MREVNRDARRKQNHGVPERQVSDPRGNTGRGHRLVRIGKYGRVRVVHDWPLGCEVRPQIFTGDAFGAFAADPRHRVVAGVEQCAEERGEEHHFGKDEPAHAPHERAFHLGVRNAGVVFLNDLREPEEQHQPENRRADVQGRMARRLTGLQQVQPVTDADERQENAERDEDGIPTVVRDVVDRVVVIVIVCRHDAVAP